MGGSLCVQPSNPTEPALLAAKEVEFFLLVFFRRGGAASFVSLGVCLPVCLCVFICLHVCVHGLSP